MSSEKKEKSAQARKQEILDLFEAWVKEREAANDWSKYVSKAGDKLIRREISEELSFARSTWNANDELQEKLFKTEENLRKKGILGQVKEKSVDAVKAESDRTSRTLGKSQSRVKNLEQQLAALTAERDDLKRRVDRLEFLEHHMSKSGRVPY